MSRVNGAKNWTKGEVAILLRMAADGVSVKGIAGAIGRTEQAVHAKLSRIKAAVSAAKANNKKPEPYKAPKMVATSPAINTFSRDQREEIAKISLAMMSEVSRAAQKRAQEVVPQPKKRGFFARIFGFKHD